MDDNIGAIIRDSFKLKPEKLFMDELKWRYLVRSVLRGKNVLLLGSAGQGKTFAALSAVDALSETVTEEMTEERLSLLKSDPTVKILKIDALNDL